MTECIDTIERRPGPLEALTARLSLALVHIARFIDQAAIRGLDLVFQWRARAAERDVMRSLDDRMLRDVGISRADLERELHKPFWQP